jgi:hypothetical protein
LRRPSGKDPPSVTAFSLRNAGTALKVPWSNTMPQPDRSPKQLGVMSPYQDPPQPVEPPKEGFPMKSLIIAIYSTVLVLLLVLVGVLLWRRTVDNPYRTLEIFPTQTYFDNAPSLFGNKFQAKLRVEGDLGWSPGVGRLMVFSVEGDSRYIPVMVKGDQDSFSFNKGQT